MLQAYVAGKVAQAAQLANLAVRARQPKGQIGNLQRADVSASWVTRNTPPNIPAILLGMLAVDADYRGQGLGSALLQDAVIRSRFVANNIGAKVLVVDPLTPELEGFYERFGFKRIADTGMLAARL